MHLYTTVSPEAAVQLPKGVDPKRTEAVLLEQEGVLDASVWWDQGMLAAHVTLDSEATWTERELQAICMESVGLHQTPRRVVFIATRPYLYFAAA